MAPHEMIDAIRSKDDLINFIGVIAQDLSQHPDQWENDTLQRYLAALARWLADSDGYYRNRGLAVPVEMTWKNVAEMLLAAKVYE